MTIHEKRAGLFRELLLRGYSSHKATLIIQTANRDGFFQEIPSGLNLQEISDALLSRLKEDGK